MNRIGEPITFIPHGKENPSDSSFLSDGEVYEINTTYGFISNYLETRNSKKVIYIPQNIFLLCFLFRLITFLQKNQI